MSLKNPYNRSVLGLFSSVAVIACTYSCGDDPKETPPVEYTGGGGQGAAGPGGTGGTGPSSGGGGNGPVCEAPEPAHMTDSLTMDSVTAQLVDQLDMPAGNVAATMCGTNVCSELAASETDGSLIVTASALALDAPRFNVGHNGRGYAKLTAIIPTAPTFDFGTVRVLRLPAFSSGAMLAPGAPATNNGVTVEVAADGVVDFFELDFPDPADHRLVAAVMDIRAIDPAELPSVPPALGIEMIVGLGPMETKLCPAAALTFPNAAQFAPDSEVEILINGNVTFEHYAPYGEWAKVAEGVVSADGTTVTTKDGQGIEVLGTFGIAPL
jgi:hypothetical protein